MLNLPLELSGEDNCATYLFRRLGDAGMVLALEELVLVENQNLLSGHLAQLMGEFNLAQV